MTGTGKKMNFPFVKQIRLNQDQMDKFSAIEIRFFLDNKTDKFMENQFIVKVLKDMFEKGVIKVYKEKLTDSYQEVLEMI